MNRVLVMLALASCGRINFDDTGQALGSCDGFAPSIGLPGLYFVETVEQSWVNARLGCFERGGDLAFPLDGNESLVLATLVANAGGTSPWVGIHDLETEGSYLNVAGQPQIFQPWDAGEPNGDTGENCVRLDAQGEFVDDSCLDANPSICACE